jgi:hypothetical protein
LIKKLFVPYITMLAISVGCYFIDPIVPKGLQDIKVYIWLLVTPGIAACKSQEFILREFTSMVIINSLWWAFWVWIFFLIKNFFTKKA